MQHTIVIPLKIPQCLLILLLCIGSVPGLTQSNAMLSIEVADPNMRPHAHVEIMLQENSSHEKLIAFTNSKGKVDFVIGSGHNWTVYIDGYRYEKQVIERDENSESELSLFITHNPALFERLNKQIFVRNSLQLKTINQAGLNFDGTRPGFFNIEIKVTNSHGLIQSGKQVHIVCLAEKK